MRGLGFRAFGLRAQILGCRAWDHRILECFGANYHGGWETATVGLSREVRI